MYITGDRVAFKNCRFLGNQDTIFAAGETARQYFVDCYIEGTTDFIFGPSTAVFQNCTIRAKSNSFITAANTTPGKKFGFVFLNCQIIADSIVSKLYLGRPWRAHAKTAFINSELPAVMAPEGWNNWGNPENEKTVLYAEYQNTGKGADLKKRVPWVKQLSRDEAKFYTPENIFSNEASVPDDNTWIRQIRTKLFEWPTSEKNKG